MKKLLAIGCMALLVTGANAQGLVNILNGTAQLVSIDTDGAGTNAPVVATGAAQSYFYALLTAPTGTTDPRAFTASNLTATNLATAGSVFGGTARSVTGWAAGTSRAFEFAGWSASLGTTFNAAWLQGDFGSATGFFGISMIGAGLAGGIDSNGATVPNLNLFGAAPAINTGWVLNPVAPIPEPASMALFGLGAAALLIFRRR